MRWIKGLTARAHGRRRQMAVAGALAGAAALAVGVAALPPSGPDDGGPDREAPRAELAAPTPTTGRAAPTTVPTAPPTTVASVAAARVRPVPTTAPPQSQPATPADAGEYAEYGDTGDEYDEYGECGEYGDAGDESVPPEEPVFEALPDGRYAALLVSMNTDAGVVGLDVLDLLVDPDGGQHFSNPESRVRLMYMTSDVELTGVVAPPSPNVYWATVEGGFVTGLEPAS